ncbi:cell wall-associated NlpC family hydrolase [Luteococcus japonicus]|uniref:Cell wall-associated NlpC family hydrolase n=1 Tax=Luteococcus japonicus TaxID=33984 RepID=A0A3N1ZSU6_9ACTN|nr:NlpC/P60 family protein [Luteococcus japonicus]ROR53940.1 cell wall-associated NlpC family hydrolase [Luteococcus japonicus]
MSNLTKSLMAVTASAAVGFGSFAGATAPAEAAGLRCSTTRLSTPCSKQNARQITTYVKYGSKGKSVKHLQRALSQVGYRVSDTGYFGPATRTQLKKYQASRKLSAVGSVNSSTLHALRVGAGAKRVSVKKASTARSAVTSSYSSSSSKGTRAVSFAYSQIGKPYRYGATGPSSYDCSGLTGAAWRSAGKSIPRTSHAQLGGLKRVSKSSLKPGDIVGFYGGGHVGIYVGNGYIIHAPRTGQNVKKVPMSQMRFYSAVRPA